MTASEHLAGTRLPVAHGFSTVYADMDFETYSEAGHYFDKEAGRFKGVNKSKKGLSVVGSAAYAQHPSTRVMCLAYNLKDGLGPRLWEEGDPPPEDLFAYLAGGGLVEAHNAIFEYFIWTYVCAQRLGWPPIDHKQLRCSMSKAAAFALPMALEKLAVALGANVQKDIAGKAIMLKLSQPRTPTKSNVALRYTREANSDMFRVLGAYCLTDIEAESDVSAMLPDLQPDELDLWLLDQEINIRGVHIDRASLDNCISIVQQAFAKYAEELKQLCGGYNDPLTGEWCWNVESPAELDKIKSFLFAKGVRTNSLDAEHLAALLARDDLPPDCRRVLEIRDMLGASSVKKLFALLNHICDDDRVRGLFAFCGADRTGRFAGRGPQPQNMPSGGPSLLQCDKVHGCGHLYQKRLNACPWCHADVAFSSPGEWGPEGVEQALKVIASRNLHYVEHYYGDAVAVISGCLRGLFTAAPGKDLICSDFSAIEAVVLAELAGEDWRREVFQTHGKIYEMSAAKISGISFEEFMRCAGYTDLSKEKWWEDPQTGSHHKLRKTLGKVAELACFGPDTMVLTRTGYKRIVGVTTEDELWDGETWVKHSGVVKKGTRTVLNLDGVKVTPQHPIYLGDSWTEASQLVSNKSTLIRALEVALESLPSSVTSRKVVEGLLKSSAHVGPRRTASISSTSLREKALAVICALKRKVAALCMSSTIGNTLTPCPIKSIDAGCSIGLAPLEDGAKNPTTKCTPTMEEEASESMSFGKQIKPIFSDTYRRSKVGTFPSMKWIGRMLTGTTSPGTSGSLLAGKTCLTNEAFLKCKNESTSLSDVYDIVDVGPRNRFTIATNNGHLIVHNSGFGGWIGAWKNFGADKFMNDEEIKQAILAWRDASPAIVEFWGGQWRKNPYKWEFKPEFHGLEGAAIQAVMNPGQAYAVRSVTYQVHGDVLYCKLPSGRLLSYHQPRLTQSTAPHDNPVWQLTYMGQDEVGRWVRLDTYFGKLCENIVQSVARDILTFAMRNLARAGYPIVLHIHDEIVAEVDKGFGSIEEFERIMATMPEWCKDWPIRAAGGWRGLRYRKG